MSNSINVLQESDLYLYKRSTCQLQVQTTSYKSLVSLTLLGNVFQNFHMPSSSKEELEEPLTHQGIQQPRNLEERQLFENPREFREKYRLYVKAFEYLLAVVGQQLEKINLVQLQLTPVVYKCIQVPLQYCKAMDVHYNWLHV